ncbi:M56 family metallopeptidase [Flavobacterium psychrotrophum]|uniref:M56 family metallopeptidase n=1 Tax=Flavobacterium psychrotrophum TaxID=2294119 RepID=UPI000E321424|nr:M56 family metallopeptidase [Flavobacterium psychrotrophum]
MVTFLLKSTIAMAVLFGIYHLFLEKEKMHRFNRFYLLGALVFSLILPFVSIQDMPGLYSAELPELILTDKADAETGHTAGWYIAVVAVYALVALLFLVRFISGIRAFYKTSYINKVVKKYRYIFVLVDGLPLPYTFANMVFVNRSEYEHNAIPEQLFIHELAHARQWHTLDVVFIEILKMVFWFNPLLYFYKRAMQLNHEFLADQAVVQQGNDTLQYLELLLEKASYKTNVKLAHNLNFLITKKRLDMITKTSNPIKKIIKQMAVLPLAIAMIFVSCADDNTDTKSTEVQKIAKDNTEQNGEVYNLDALQKQPEFPGGISSFMGTIQKSFAMPEIDKDLTAKIYLSFVIETNGEITNIKVIKDPGYGLGEEAARALSSIEKKWQPGELNGVPVRTSFTLPITINIKN